MDYKAIVLDAFKDVDQKQGIVTGYLAAFNNVDEYNDMIIPGAFKKTLSENSNALPYLFGHDLMQPIGKVLSLEEDNYGLKFEAKFSKAPFAQDKLLMVQEGILDTNSIGYKTIKAQPNGEVRELKEIRLFEGSLVTIPANAKAIITGLKTLSAPQLLVSVYERMNKLSSYLSKSKIMDENTFKSLSEELATLASIVQDAEAKMMASVDDLKKEVEALKQKPSENDTLKEQERIAQQADEDLAAAVLEALNQLSN